MNDAEVGSGDRPHPRILVRNSFRQQGKDDSDVEGAALLELADRAQRFAAEDGIRAGQRVAQRLEGRAPHVAERDGGFGGESGLRQHGRYFRDGWRGSLAQDPAGLEGPLEPLGIRLRIAEDGLDGRQRRGAKLSHPPGRRFDLPRVLAVQLVHPAVVRGGDR